MSKRSKFFEMTNPAPKKEEASVPVTIDADINELLQEVAELEKAPVVEAKVEEVEVFEETIEQVKDDETRRAYNIWLDNDKRVYMIDIFEYKNGEVISFTSEMLSQSQAKAMYRAKEIFTQKIVIRKKGV